MNILDSVILCVILELPIWFLALIYLSGDVDGSGQLDFDEVHKLLEQLHNDMDPLPKNIPIMGSYNINQYGRPEYCVKQCVLMCSINDGIAGIWNAHDSTLEHWPARSWEGWMLGEGSFGRSRSLHVQWEKHHFLGSFLAKSTPPKHGPSKLPCLKVEIPWPDQNCRVHIF